MESNNSGDGDGDGDGDQLQKRVSRPNSRFAGSISRPAVSATSAAPVTPPTAGSSIPHKTYSGAISIRRRRSGNQLPLGVSFEFSTTYEPRGNLKEESAFILHYARQHSWLDKARSISEIECTENGNCLRCVRELNEEQIQREIDEYRAQTEIEELPLEEVLSGDANVELPEDAESILALYRQELAKLPRQASRRRPSPESGVVSDGEQSNDSSLAFEADAQQPNPLNAILEASKASKETPRRQTATAADSTHFIVKYIYPDKRSFKVEDKEKPSGFARLVHYRVDWQSHPIEANPQTGLLDFSEETERKISWRIPMEYRRNAENAWLRVLFEWSQQAAGPRRHIEQHLPGGDSDAEAEQEQEHSNEPSPKRRRMGDDAGEPLALANVPAQHGTAHPDYPEAPNLCVFTDRDDFLQNIENALISAKMILVKASALRDPTGQSDFDPSAFEPDHFSSNLLSHSRCDVIKQEYHSDECLASCTSRTQLAFTCVNNGKQKESKTLDQLLKHRAANPAERSNLRCGRSIRFYSNFTLPRPYCAAQYRMLSRLPAPLALSGPSADGLLLLPTISGFNELYYYPKLTGDTTCCHQENNSLISVNVCVGSGSCEWVYLLDQYTNRLTEALKREHLTHNSPFWLSATACAQSGLPIERFNQQHGDMVIVGLGTWHCVRALGNTANIAYNIAPYRAEVFRRMVAQEATNVLHKTKSLVHPVIFALLLGTTLMKQYDSRLRVNAAVNGEGISVDADYAATVRDYLKARLSESMDDLAAWNGYSTARKIDTEQSNWHYHAKWCDICQASLWNVQIYAQTVARAKLVKRAKGSLVEKNHLERLVELDQKPFTDRDAKASLQRDAFCRECARKVELTPETRDAAMQYLFDEADIQPFIDFFDDLAQQNQSAPQAPPPQPIVLARNSAPNPPPAQAPLDVGSQVVAQLEPIAAPRAEPEVVPHDEPIMAPQAEPAEAPQAGEAENEAEFRMEPPVPIPLPEPRVAAPFQVAFNLAPPSPLEQEPNPEPDSTTSPEGDQLNLLFQIE